MEPVAVLRSQLSVLGQSQDGSDDIFPSLLTFNFPLLILMLLHALHERLCTVPLNRLPCYGALEVIMTLLLLVYYIIITNHPGQFSLAILPCNEYQRKLERQLYRSGVAMAMHH